MPAEFVVGPFTIGPGDPACGFVFSWSPGQHPNKGPVFGMFSPFHPPKAEDVKMWITNYGQGRSVQGPVYYSCDVSNSCSQAVNAWFDAVYWPEFQSDWDGNG
jgi:hypothetical protein